jgi:hypothetical protein
MALRDAPEPWATAMRKAGLVRSNGAANMSALGRAAGGVHTSTISAMMFGERETSPQVVDAVAEALRLPRSQVHEWVGRALSEPRRFEPHPDADLLDSDERAAVNELIRLLARPRKTGRTGARKPRS